MQFKRLLAGMLAGLTMTTSVPLANTGISFDLQAHAEGETQTNAPPLNDNGTETDTSDDFYELDSADDLYWFAELVNGTLDGVEQNQAANAKLTANITVNERVLLEDGSLNEEEAVNFRQWTPIGNKEFPSRVPYQGVFDGNGYTISGLYYNNQEKVDCMGLFGCADSAKIQNINVKDLYFSGNAIGMGGICGGTYNGTQLINCSVTGTMVNNNGDLGGIVGVNRGTVLNCHTVITLSGSQRMGGISGANDTTISNCYAIGSISGSGYLGGITGTHLYDAAISTCYAMVILPTGENTGGIAGFMNTYSGGKQGTISNSYYLKQENIDATGNGGEVATAKTEEEFASGDVCYLLNNDPSNLSFYQNLGTDLYPNLDAASGIVYQTTLCSGSIGYSNTMENPHLYQNGFCSKCGTYEPATQNADDVYEIDNAGKLYWFAGLVNGTLDGVAQNTAAHAKLTADLQLDGKNHTWASIGTESNPYTGTMDGQNHHISDFYLQTSESYQGLFGACENATIQNMTVDGTLEIQEGNDSFGLIGIAKSGNISNVTSNLIITETDKAVDHVGGIVGSAVPNENGVTIVNCTFGGSISIHTNKGCFGCIVGYTNEKTSIQNCINLGTLQGDQDGTYLGGILGYVNNADFQGIQNCYNYGTITGTGTKIGAIIGYAKNKDYSKVVTNNYYLDSSCSNAFGTEGTNLKGTATAKSAEAFASGEVCYLLNGNQSDIHFYQEIGTDAYPTLDASRGTVYKSSPCTGYTNSTDENPHAYDENGFCSKCGAYEPATQNTDDVYEIDNAGKLYWFAGLVNGTLDGVTQNTAAHAKLTADLQLDGKNHTWASIGTESKPYTGTMDGQNHHISDFYLKTSESYQGLFGACRNATIQNMTVDGQLEIQGSTVTINSFGLIGRAEAGSISNITSNLIITETGGAVAHVGGVVGDIITGAIVKDCIFGGSISMNTSIDCIGGVVGYANDYTMIQNCINHGTIQADQEGAFLGGILGYINVSTFRGVQNCYNYGSITGTGTRIGAIIGYSKSNDYSKVVTNNYYLDSSCATGFGTEGTNRKGTATAKSAEAFANGEVCYLLNGDQSDIHFYQEIGTDAYPTLDASKSVVYRCAPCIGTGSAYTNDADNANRPHTFENGFCTTCNAFESATQNAEGYYEIDNAGKLYWFAGLVNGTLDGVAQDTAAYAKLTADLQLDGKNHTWTPIGTESKPYAGTMDGQNHHISDFYLQTSGSYQGLFGACRNATIQNMTVDGTLEIQEGDTDFGLIGKLETGNISNITSNLMITETGKAVAHVGGVVGQAISTFYGVSTNVKDCTFGGRISVNTSIDCISGVVGYANSYVMIQNCINLGTIQADQEGALLGGILGYVNTYRFQGVQNCYNYGTP